MSDCTDQELANRYGAYASFETEASPLLVEYYGLSRDFRGDHKM